MQVEQTEEENQQPESSHEKGKAEKRKRSEQSSTSELDASTVGTKESQQNSKTKKKSKKLAKPEQKIDEFFSNTNDDKQVKSEMKEIRKQLKEVNGKLGSVINKVDKTDKKLEEAVMKNDGSLRSVLREMITEMKEELLNSLVNRLEILEKRIYDREVKTEELQSEVKRLQKEVVKQKDENETLRKNSNQTDDRMTKIQNDSEQYSRLNNIRIHGIVSGNAYETAEETTNIVVKTLNEKMNIGLRTEDIDLAHRTKKFTAGSQEAIVRLQSRLVKENILRNRRKLKGTGIYINEDLTYLNQQVMMSVKRKMPDEVGNVFTRNGIIKYITKTNQLKTVTYKDYQHWLDLPWPARRPATPPNRRDSPRNER